MQKIFEVNNKAIFVLDAIHEHSNLKEDNNIYVIPAHWYVYSGDEPDAIPQFSAKYVADLTKNVNVVCLANSREEEQNYLVHMPSDKVLFCNRHFNHGLLRDGTRAYYPSSVEKIYDVIYIGGHNKMQEKLKYLKNLCILDRYVKEPRIECAYYNTSLIDRKGVTSFINQSRIGCVMTEIEGASWASLEFLLCGIPVVSCKSKGGRDIFYNKNNSVILEREEWYSLSVRGQEDYCIDLKTTVDNMLKNYSTYDPTTIRNEALDICNIHKGYLVEKLNSYYSGDYRTQISQALDACCLLTN